MRELGVGTIVDPIGVPEQFLGRVRALLALGAELGIAGKELGDLCIGLGRAEDAHVCDQSIQVLGVGVSRPPAHAELVRARRGVVPHRHLPDLLAIDVEADLAVLHLASSLRDSPPELDTPSVRSVGLCPSVSFARRLRAGLPAKHAAHPSCVVRSSRARRAVRVVP